MVLHAVLYKYLPLSLFLSGKLRKLNTWWKHIGKLGGECKLTDRRYYEGAGEPYGGNHSAIYTYIKSSRCTSQLTQYYRYINYILISKKKTETRPPYGAGGDFFKKYFYSSIFHRDQAITYTSTICWTYQMVFSGEDKQVVHAGALRCFPLPTNSSNVWVFTWDLNLLPKYWEYKGKNTMQAKRIKRSQVYAWPLWLSGWTPTHEPEGHSSIPSCRQNPQ